MTGDNDFNVPEADDTERELLDELADLEDADDQAKVTGDNAKVSTFRTQAVEKAQLLGIALSDEEAATTLGLFRKVICHQFISNPAIADNSPGCRPCTVHSRFSNPSGKIQGACWDGQSDEGVDTAGCYPLEHGL